MEAGYPAENSTASPAAANTSPKAADTSPKAAVANGADLAALQTELKAAKEKWTETKLGKAKKESETFPYPVWVLQATQQPPAAKAYDVMEIPVKLVVDGLEAGQIHVEIPSPEIPKQLQDKIASAVLAQWTKYIGKKAAPWGIVKTFEWVETNFVKMLTLDPACVGPYEGCDENGATVRRYAIAAPTVYEEVEEEEEDSEDEEAYAQQVMAERIAALLAESEAADSGGRKKLSPEEIEARKAEAAEMGEKAKMLSKEERAALNKTRKEKSGHRQAKTGQANKKFDGEGSTSKEDKKKKQDANIKKRFGIG